MQRADSAEYAQKAGQQGPFRVNSALEVREQANSAHGASLANRRPPAQFHGQTVRNEANRPPERAGALF